ncbi:MAG: hypothetical protein KDD42_08040 [Bdellovibrionales bacterium]|nr:hypothetical protein [Bdellovibrionales bacterium]
MMKELKTKLILVGRQFWIAAVLFALAGCGGGTSGTGDLPVTRFMGIVSDSNGEGVGEAQLTIDETGDTAFSSADGSFVLEARLKGSSANLVVSSDMIEQTVRIQDLPDVDADVNLELRVDSINQVITVQSIHVEILSGDRDPGESESDQDDHNSPQVPISATPPVEEERPEIGDSESERIRTIYRGQLIDQNNRGVPHALIRHLEANKSVRTDQYGNFSFVTQSYGGTVTIDISYLKYSGTVHIYGTPSNQSALITLALRIKGLAVITPIGDDKGGYPAEDQREEVSFELQDVKIRLSR